MHARSKNIRLFSWLLALSLLLGVADDALADKKKKKKKNKEKETAEETVEQESPVSRPPAVVGDVETRLLAYDTNAARQLLASEAVDSNVHLRIADGRVLDQEAKYTQAIDRLSTAADEAASDPAPLVYLGEAYLKAGSTGPATDAFARAEQRARAILSAAPNDLDALYHLGVAQQRQKRFPDAISTLEKARAQSPRNALVLYQLGATHAFHRDWQNAIDRLTQALEVNPGIAYAYYYRGLAAGEVGRKDLLVNDLDRFLTMAPNAPEAEQARRLLGGL